MKDSLGGSVALKKGQPWSLNSRCNLCAQEEARWGLRVVKPLRQMSQVSSSSPESPFPRELCLFCTAHLPVLGSLCILSPGLHSPDRNEAMFPGKVPVGLPVASSKLGAFKETDRNLDRGDHSIVLSFATLIQFIWGTFRMPQRKLRKVSAGLQGKAQGGNESYLFKHSVPRTVPANRNTSHT